MPEKAPRLDALARAINEKVPGVVAVIEKGFFNTDQSLRFPGKGRTGNRLIVYDRQWKVIIDHNSAETYRTNDEAALEVENLWGRIWEPDVYPSSTDPPRRMLREQAINRGFLVDLNRKNLSEVVRVTGVRLPVAVTFRVWVDCINLTVKDSNLGDTQLRAYEVLSVFMERVTKNLKLRRIPVTGPVTLHFVVAITANGTPPTTVALKSIIGPGDYGEPVATILYPDESWPLAALTATVKRRECDLSPPLDLSPPQIRVNVDPFSEGWGTTKEDLISNLEAQRIFTRDDISRMACDFDTEPDDDDFWPRKGRDVTPRVRR